MAGHHRTHTQIKAPGTASGAPEAGPEPFPDEPAEDSPAPASRPAPWGRRDVLILVALLALAGLLRFPRLSEPHDIVFDETYYAKDACLYAGNTQQFCGLEQDTEQSYVHPPLGKWLIALGIEAFGYNSLGWRFAAAVAGTGLAGIAYLFARQLFESRWIGGAAGLLTATDFLLIAQSRIAMLDIFLVFFVLLGFTCLAFHRRRVFPNQIPADAQAVAKQSTGGSGWLVAAGVCFGLGLAVKWSAVWALAAALIITFGWSLKPPAEGRKESRARRISGAGKALLRCSVALLVVPSLIYLAAYSPYFVDRFNQKCPYTVPAKSPDRRFSEGFAGMEAGRCVKGSPGAILSFADLQERVFDYHRTLKAKHSYQSKAWTWPLVLRPVAYYFEGNEKRSTNAHILAFANIATWYPALGAAAWLLIDVFRRKRAAGIVLMGWGAQYLPWLLVSRPLFFFYITPVVPFMMAALAVGLDKIRRKGKLGRRLVIAYFVLGVGLMLVYFYPVITAIPLPQNLWQSRMLLEQFDCGNIKCGWI